MNGYETDTKIYALATAFTQSALAVLRLSGTGSVSAFTSLFSSPLGNVKSGGTKHGYILDDKKEIIDEVMVIKYMKGHGYTKEEAIEIICHGSLAVIKKIMLSLEKIGFRKALPGEFTYRAFMHGSMDLTEAEAVEELVKAESDISRTDALKRLNGSIKAEADSVKDIILNTLASLEVYLDYGEDEILEDWTFPENKIKESIERLRRISCTYSSSRLYSQGAKVVLLGRTNAGKSSLFNALLKENRAIVSSVAGTTRDYLETRLMLEDIPLCLFDTAGLRESSDEVEIEGIRRTQDLIESADLVLYLVDKDEKVEEIKENYLYLYPKMDLYGERGELSFSSQTGEGLARVISEIKNRLIVDRKRESGVPQIDSERQKEKLEETAESLENALKAKSESADIIALYLQSALSSLAELTGEVTNEELLDVLFSSFCLGK